MAAPEMKRPTGVTIVGVLDLIAGIIGIIAGLAFVGLGSVLVANPNLINEAETPQLMEPNPFYLPSEFMGYAILALGAVLLPISIVSLIVAYGTFKGKGWAWMVTVVISYISIAVGIIEIAFSDGGISSIASGAVSIGISTLILYYLYRPHVKAFFGKAVPATRSQT